MVGGVDDTRAQGGHITFTDEARHVGLYHHILLGNGLRLGNGIIHLRIVSQSDEAPGSDTLGKREAKRDVSLRIRLHSRIEEGRLVEVLTDLGRRRLLLFLRCFLHFIPIFHNGPCISGLLFCSRPHDDHLLQSVITSLHRDISTRTSSHRGLGHQDTAITVEPWTDTFKPELIAEMREIPSHGLQFLPGQITIHAHACGAIPTPIGVGQILIKAQR